MASLEQIGAALKAADAAGNIEDAKRLAAAYKAMQSQGGVGQEAMANASAMSQKLAGPVPQRPEVAAANNYPSQIISGVGEGIGNILGAPVDLATTAINLGTTGINALTDMIPREKGLNELITGERAPNPYAIPQITNPALGSDAFRGVLSTVGAIRPESDDPGMRFARRASQDVGSALIPSVSIAGRAAQPIQALIAEALMATGSGVGGATAEANFPGNPLAETLGGLGGALTGAGVGRAARKLITPFPSDPTRIAAADAMRNEGVDLSAGQQTGSQGLKYAEAELGGGAASRLTEQQAEQFTQAALRRIGEDATRATPEVMNRAYERIGGVFNDVGARNQIAGDRQLVDDLRTTWDDYTGRTAPSDRAPNIHNFISEIADAMRANGGTLSGDVYVSLRARLGQLARRTTNRDQQEALYGIQHSLDDAMERNMSPEDIADFRNARREYRNFITLEMAGSGAGENAALGLISPAQLRQATVNTQGRRNYMTGTGDFSDLARNGVATMSPLPQSGTAPRVAVNAIKGGVPGLAALLAGGGSLGLGTLAGAAGGYGAVKGAGAAMMSPWGRRYLANQLMRRGNAPIGQGAGALMAIGSQQTSEPLKITVGRGR